MLLANMLIVTFLVLLKVKRASIFVKLIAKLFAKPLVAPVDYFCYLKELVEMDYFDSIFLNHFNIAYLLQVTQVISHFVSRR